MIEILLYTAFGYLAVTTLILLQNRQDFIPLRSAASHEFDSSAPLVSICIPARNEEQNIERCVQSALLQSYPNIEILVLDDQSTDRTGDILERIRSNQSTARLVIKQGIPKPREWLGKPWACQQLAEHSSGDILLFIDADTRLQSDAVAYVVRTMGHDLVDFLTVWPMQELRTFWEKTVIPLVYYALLSLLPARYVHRAPAWLPPSLRRRLSPLFSAACGQFMAFKRETYEAIGGHSSVKKRIVEDVALAQLIKQAGFSMRMYHGRGTVNCRMYRTPDGLYNGFRKNFLAGFDHNIILFAAMGLLHIVVYVLPYLFMPAGLLTGNSVWTLVSTTCIGIITFHRFLLARWYEWSPSYALLHPLGVLWFQMLGLQVLKDYFENNPVHWKERPV